MSVLENEWKIIGHVLSESGNIMICDATLIGSDWNQYERFSYARVSKRDKEKLWIQTWNRYESVPMAITFNSRETNIHYPVYAKMRDGREAEVKVVMVERSTFKNSKMSEQEDEWIFMGEVLVDSGRLMICDPGLLGTKKDHRIRFWSGWGDGVYPVYAKVKGGRISEVSVVMM